LIWRMVVLLFILWTNKQWYHWCCFPDKRHTKHVPRTNDGIVGSARPFNRGLRNYRRRTDCMHLAPSNFSVVEGLYLMTPTMSKATMLQNIYRLDPLWPPVPAKWSKTSDRSKNKQFIVKMRQKAKYMERKMPGMCLQRSKLCPFEARWPPFSRHVMPWCLCLLQESTFRLVMTWKKKFKLLRTTLDD